MTDRLEEIKANWSGDRLPLRVDEIDWLISEVERLRDIVQSKEEAAQSTARVHTGVLPWKTGRRV